MDDAHKKAQNESLRTRALDLLKNKMTVTGEIHSEADLQKLLHELDVYRVELELQNQELLQAKDAAELATEKYIGLYETVSSGYFTLTREGRITELNHVGAAMLGKEKSGLINNSFGFFVDREFLEAYNRFFARIFENKKAETCEILFSVKGKLPVYAYISGQVTPNGNFCHLSVTDIAEGSLTEVKLLKVNRINAFSSQINQAIVHIRDQQVLFDEACRIAVEYGKFRMAWIGMVDESTQQVNPVSFFGVEDGYLNQIHKISVNKTAEGQGPTGTTIREGSYTICNDIALDPRMAAWKDKALARGYRSSIALPLTSFGKIVGAFSLYSNIPHFFNKQETDLLVEVANNISFALEYIEQERKNEKAEAALRENQELFKLFIQNSPYFAFIKEVSPTESRVLHASDNYIDMLGISASEMVGKTMQELFPPELAKKMTADDWVVVSGGNILQLDEDMNDRFYTTIKYPILVGEKKLLAGYTVDITERIHHEEILKASEIKFRSAFENASVGMCLTGVDGKLLQVNSTFCNMLGYTRDELLLKTFREFTHPDDINFSISVIDSALNGGNWDAQFEKRYLRKDGEILWVDISSSLVKDANDKPLYFITHIIDITVRKLAQLRLAKSEDHYRQATRAGNVAAWHTLPPGMKLESGGAVEALIGYKEGEIDNWYKVTHPDDLDRLEKLRKEIYTNNPGKYSIEYRMIHKDGSTRWVWVRGQAYFDNEGHLLEVVGTTQDITERKLAEAAHSRLFHILESSLNEIYVFDAKTLVFEYVNRGALHNLGYSMESMLKMTPLDLKPGFDKVSFAKLIDPLLSHQQEQLIFETFHLRADGSLYPVEVHLQLVGNKGDDVFLAIIQDITLRRKSEELLRISEEKFRKAFETSPDVININRMSDGMYISVNHGFTNILGYTEADVLGRTSLEKNIWHNSADRKKLVAGLKKNGFVENLVARFRHKDGSIIYGMMSARIIELDGVQHILSITRNINERIKFEQALKASEEKYRSIFENVQDVYYETMLDGTILEVSPAIKIISGGNYESRDLIGLSMYEFYADSRQRDNLIAMMIKSGSVTGFEIQLKNRDGSLIHCSLSAKIKFDTGGHPVKIIGSMHDISRRKNAEDELLRLNDTLEQRVVQRTEQLEKANAELESFSYSVSHDLRAPLRHIEGFIDLFLELKASEPTAQELGYLDIVSKSTGEMNRLIDALLSFSKLSLSDIRKNSINTNLLVSNTIKFFGDQIGERDIEFLPELLPESYGDPQLLQQVWTNLLSNAIKYTAKKEKAIIEIGSCRGADETVFFVKDNGAGFNMAYAAKLFGVFQRLHKPKDFEGVGIGLANVNRIISRHGGRCWAEGEVGIGATFYFSLPSREKSGYSSNR